MKYKKITDTEQIKIKESVTIKKEKATYLIFYKEFYKNFLRKSEGQNFIILSGLFLHLTFEGLTTQIIRWVIEVVYKHQRTDITDLWYNIFETQNLKKKLEFLQSAILIRDKEAARSIKQLNQFFNKLARFRNKIVHGHEISKTFHYNTGQRSESKLSELATKGNIERLYKEFWDKLDIFLILFNKINIPPNVSLGQDFIKRDIIESTKSILKNIETNLTK